MQIALEGSCLVVRFAQPQATASWAIVGGGVRSASSVLWLQVRDANLSLVIDPRALLLERMAEHGIAEHGIGLMTSRRLAAFVDVTHELHGVSARCIATVGLGNALRAGDAPAASAKPGTINLLCRVSEPLSTEALLEALALASEAKALAVREAEVPSAISGEPASGTGTDCIVIAAPLAERGPDGREVASYAGKHTTLGHVIGAAVHAAIARGVRAWLSEQEPPR